MSKLTYSEQLASLGLEI